MKKIVSVRKWLGDFSSKKVPTVNKKSDFYAMKAKIRFHRVNGGCQFTQKQQHLSGNRIKFHG